MLESTVNGGLRPAGLPPIQRSGRWKTTNTGTLVACWCGASISFLYTGQSLSIRAGPLTERKDCFNGGAPMIACVISGPAKDDVVGLYDPEPSQTMQLFRVSESDRENYGSPRIVELTLVDWASVFELEAIITSSAADIHPLPIVPIRSLFIGDSISCGYTNGSEPIPRGCLDAFPFLARDALRRQTGIQMAVDMVAFPGITLTDPANEDLGAEERLPNGMETRFFHFSPWSDSPYGSEYFDPDLLVVPLGSNDDAQGVDSQRFQSALCTFVSKLSIRYSKSLKHIVVVHPFVDFTDEEADEETTSKQVASLASHFPSFVKAIFTCAPHCKISLHDFGTSIQRQHTMDGLHPTAEGHKILGEAWMDALRPIMEKLVPGFHV